MRWCCCGPTTSAPSSTTARGASGPTRSSGDTRGCRRARSTRSTAGTGSSRPTASPRSASFAACRPQTVLAWWRGHPAGWWDPREYGVASIAVPIATHVPHAVGFAWGKKLRGEPACAIAYFGDGATSEGAFHEGANFAAVMRAPVVLFCNNNGWAISTPVEAQTRAASLADKAVGYGMPGVRVDGGDVLAVYEATREAVNRARAGDGPTLIEAVTYRCAPHATADDPSAYIDPERVEVERANECRRPLRALPPSAGAPWRRSRRVDRRRREGGHAGWDRRRGGAARARSRPGDEERLCRVGLWSRR